MNQSTSGDWHLYASTSLTSEVLENALSEAKDMDIFHIPANADEVDDAIASMKSATNRPVWMDGTDALNWEKTLADAMADYPTDVVVSACKAWRQIPQHGKWWPTEQDLRQQCETIFFPRKSLFNRARMLLQDLRAKETQSAYQETDHSVFAGDKCKSFRNQMRKRMRERTFNAYFHPSHILYGEDLIWVRSKTAERVMRERGEDILQELGIRVEFNQVAFLNIREPTYDDDTLEERAETAARFHRLGEAMAKGENIAKLRAEGVI